MIKYSKSLGNLIQYKNDFFANNEISRENAEKVANIYASQPLRNTCKNCDNTLKKDSSNSFSLQGIYYYFCTSCGHLNGAHEDTEKFCEYIYAEDDGKNYSANYTPEDKKEYLSRTRDIYLPKAKFLKEALEEVNRFPVSLSDFGAGAGYFIAAAKQTGFKEIIGFEPSKSLSDLGNKISEENIIKTHSLTEIDDLIESATSEVASFIGVLEHLQNPRNALNSIRKNKHINFIYISVPLFSPTVVIESMFPESTTRHLAGGHTHLYTEQSIDYFCDEFGFKRISEWWFGLDITDFYRSILISTQKNNETVLSEYWESSFLPLIDNLQASLDNNKTCSEVHMLLQKT
jgi:hypothetical protein